MKGRNFQSILFIFWTILATLSAVWIIINLVFDEKLILTKTVYQYVTIISSLTLIISVISIREMLIKTKNKIIDRQIKERNIKDCYRYQQLLDPPDADMNN